MLEYLLPLLRGWAYQPIDVDRPILIKAGTTRHLYKVEYKGWVISMLVTLNNPDARIVLEGRDALGTPIRVDLNLKEIYESGLTFWTPNTMYTPRYDPDNNIYIGVYTPIPWLSFLEASASIVSPPDKDTIILNAYANIIVIKNEEEFRKSLMEIFGLKTLGEIAFR